MTSEDFYFPPIIFDKILSHFVFVFPFLNEEEKEKSQFKTYGIGKYCYKITHAESALKNREKF